MIGNHTMVHHVQPWDLYSHDGTCTHSGLRRIPTSLVAFHICYFLIMPVFIRCQLSWPDSSVLSDIFIHYGYLVHYILYVAMTTCDICLLCLFISIVLLCIQGLLHFIFVVTCWDLSLYCTDERPVFPPGSSLIHFWDWYNVFRPSCYPSDLTH